MNSLISALVMLLINFYDIIAINIFLKLGSKENTKMEKRSLYLIVFIFVIWSGLSLYSTGSIINFALSLIIVYIIASSYIKSFKLVVFWVIIVASMSILSEFFSMSFLITINPQSIDSILANKHLFYIGAICTEVIKTVIFLLILLLYKNRKARKDIAIEISTKVILMLIALPILTFSFLIIRFPYLLKNSSLINSSYEMLLLLILLLANVIIIILYHSIYDIYSKSIRISNLNNQLESKKQYYKNLESSQLEIRKMKHDMKYTLLGINADISAGNFQQTTKVISNLLIEINSHRNFTSNIAINYILNEKIEEAKKLNISTELEIFIPESFEIESALLAVIYGNAFDNAIEASQLLSEEERLIAITIRYFDKKIYFEIKNKFPQTNSFFEFNTTKEDKLNHGFGLKTIKHLVAQNDGLVEYKMNGDTVIVSIILWDIK